MKKIKSLLILLPLCLALSGCGWPSSMVSVTPHREQRQNIPGEAVSVANYQELQAVMKELVHAGVETATIQLADYPAEELSEDVSRICDDLRKSDPIGAYALEEVNLEIGTSMGKPAAAVSISYRHGASDLLRIQRVDGEEQARRAVANALEELTGSLVVLKKEEEQLDFAKLVREYAWENPQTVMEPPQLTETVYGAGAEQVVELSFAYQTDREFLRRMQSLVKPMFDAASLYVSGAGDQRQKYTQLYAFLMERFDYREEPSVTPAYSLLLQGVGDSRAFAAVYCAMCRSAGLECRMVSGTRAGEPWVWNMVQVDGRYYHVDLLRCSRLGDYREFFDEEMEEYTWDTDAYPSCPADGG